jgi:heat shock protein HslJ
MQQVARKAMARLRYVKRLSGCTAILSVFLLMSACASTIPSARPDSNGSSLSGTSWTATILENDFTEGRRPTIQFREDGKVAGTTGCTVYFASIEIAGSTLRIRNLLLEPADARPGKCDSLHEAQQARFLGVLESTRLVRVQSRQTLLLDARQNLLAILEQREEPGASSAHLVTEVDESAAHAAAFGGLSSANDPLRGMELVAVTPALGKYFGADAGVLVTQVPPNNLLGLREGDVILSVNGRQPANGPHALRILRSYPPGTSLDVRVLRQRESVNLRATLSE